MTPNISLVAWAPDVDPTTPGVLVDVSNLVPTQRGYVSDSTLLASSKYMLTLSTEPSSAQTLGYIPFVAYGTTLSGYVGGAWRNLSRTGTAYTSASLIDPWTFAAFTDGTGSEFTLAIQEKNVLQAKTANSTAAFADVAGAPKAATMATLRGFVILGTYDAGGTLYPDGWICSALEDHTDWTPDIATQCAAGRLTATPGPIMRLVPFKDYVIAFKRNSIYRGTYVGAADNTWSWPVLSRSVGLVSRHAVCEADGVLYWMSDDGFYRWAGGNVERIQSAPWKTLTDRTPFELGLNILQQAVYDPSQQVIRWVFDATAPNAPQIVLTYHPNTDRWGKSISPKILLAFTLPDIGVKRQPEDKTFVYTEAPAYFVLSGGSYVLSIATGSPSTSTFTTGDIGDDDQSFALTGTRVRFLTAPTSSYAEHTYRMNLGDPLQSGEVSQRVDGKYDLSQSARWHRLKFTQTGQYEVTGMSVNMPKAGKR